MKTHGLRIAAASAAICLLTWVALAATAGNVGLQRSISKGAITLFEQPQIVVVVALVALALGYASAKLLRLSAVQLVVGVLVGDLLAGLVLAPLAIGELDPIHAPVVFAAVSLLGVQPVAVVAGAWLAKVGARDTATALDAGPDQVR
jgi:hypothetical protein